jgi:hypothetical protein
LFYAFGVIIVAHCGNAITLSIPFSFTTLLVAAYPFLLRVSLLMFAVLQMLAACAAIAAKSDSSFDYSGA